MKIFKEKEKLQQLNLIFYIKITSIKKGNNPVNIKEKN